MKTLLSIFILLQLTFLHADNYSLSFDGSDDYVTVPYSSTLNSFTDAMTVSAWVKVNSEGLKTVIENGNTQGFALLVNGSGTFYGNVQNQHPTNPWTTVYGSTTIDLNTWYHVAMTYAPGYLLLYVNGVLDGTAPESVVGNIVNNDSEMYLGRYHQYDNYFHGNMDEVAIWNDALTAAEITALYNSGLGLSAASNSGDYASASDVKGYWNFNAGTGTTLADQTLNDNDGTISGATWSTDVPPTSGGNNALSFDGDGDYVNMGSSEILSLNDFTISMWFKTSYSAPAGDWIYLLGRGDTYGFFLFGDGTLRFSLEVPSGNWGNVESDEGSGGTITVTTGTWRHSAVTRNSSTGEFKLYIDGSFVADNDDVIMGGGESGSSDLTGQITSNWPFQLSMHNNGWAVYDGNLDEVAIWNDELTSAEITALYNSGSGLIASSNSGNYTSSSNLQAYWNFNAGTGTTLTDQTSNNNDGTISGASWTGDGAPVTAATTPTNTYSLNFDGSDDYVDFGDIGDLDDGSVQIWFNYIGSENGQILVKSVSGVHWGLSIVNGVLQLSYVATAGTGWEGHSWDYLTYENVLINYWYHVIITRENSSGTISMYVNGSLVAQNTNATPGTPISNSNSLLLGTHNTNVDWLNGYADELAIWNEDLTASEVTALYNSGNGLDASSNSGNYASASNLQGYWNFNEGGGTTASDATSNSNDGTIYGATWSTDVPFTGATTTTSALTWSVRAKASLSTYNDNDNYLGVASSATNVFDASYDELEPPAAPGSSISLYFPHAEWDYLLGDNFSTDARPVVALTDTMQVWDFVVKSTDAGEATLTFVYASVPSVPVILENTATGARQTLSNNATYTFTAVADSAHTFRVSIGDTTAPTLTLGASCSGPAILISDSTHSLGWTSTDGFEVDSVLVSFSSDSGTTYSLQASLGTASSYNWTVPDAMVMTGGKLKLKAQDYAGNSKEEVSSYVFAIAGDSLSSAITAGWTLWGAPINPTNDTMTTNLNDDFSGYWVTFDYVNNGYTYNGILNEAEGYWLGAAQNATVDVKGTPVDSNFTVSLSQGWELISNPLVLDVNVDSLTFTKDNTTKTHAEAVTAGWVNSIYSYSSSGYVSATTFSPWSGYWMAVLETGVEITYPIHRNGGSRSARSIENEWMISFDAQVDGGNDGITRIGYAETATDGFDTEHDAVKPPNPPGPVYVSLFIAHPEWNYPLGDKFAKDIRAAVPANGYQEWQLTMESSESDAQLSWILVNIPDDYEVGYSIDGGQYFDDMRDVSTITISANTEIIVRVGSQVLGIGDESIPTVFALHQNYPNPFNPVTTLRYDLPENGIVTIIIYDMLGRQVKTLINQTQDAGFKSVVWNATNDYGKPVSAGIYLYQIQAGENISTKKMVLLK